MSQDMARDRHGNTEPCPHGPHLLSDNTCACGVRWTDAQIKAAVNRPGGEYPGQPVEDHGIHLGTEAGWHWGGGQKHDGADPEQCPAPDCGPGSGTEAEYLGNEPSRPGKEELCRRLEAVIAADTEDVGPSWWVPVAVSAAWSVLQPVFANAAAEAGYLGNPDTVNSGAEDESQRDIAGLRERIACVLIDKFGHGREQMDPAYWRDETEAILSVVQPELDRLRDPYRRERDTLAGESLRDDVASLREQLAHGTEENEKLRCERDRMEYQRDLNCGQAQENLERAESAERERYNAYQALAGAAEVIRQLRRERDADYSMGYEVGAADVHEEASAKCSQCGRPWQESACGPTHAIVANEQLVDDPPFAVGQCVRFLGSTGYAGQVGKVQAVDHASIDVKVSGKGFLVLAAAEDLEPWRPRPGERVVTLSGEEREVYSVHGNVVLLFDNNHWRVPLDTLRPAQGGEQ